MAKPIDMRHAERLQQSINAQMKGDVHCKDGSYPGCLPDGCLFSICTALCLLLMAVLLVSQL